MRNENNGNKSKNRRAVLIVILAMLLLAAGTFVLVRTGIFDNIGTGNESGENSVGLINIPPKDDFDILYFEPDPDDPFAYIAEFENFSATYYVYNYYKTNTYSAYSVTKYKDKFRIENDSELIIYDGKMLYTKTPLYETCVRVNDYSFFTEIGILSLEKLKELVSDKKATIELENDGMYIDVLYLLDNDRSEQYILSAENGLIISSKNSYGKEIRMNNVSFLYESDILPDTFLIPENYTEGL